ncbi:Uncharacterised protein [Mycobacteroides abscessus subsp. bolletii]|nr:Uncharacterised protein [Mycobacteroides abscessus subsp. bolletii]
MRGRNMQQRKKQNKQRPPRFPPKGTTKDDRQDRDKQSGDNDLTALLLGASSTRLRKRDGQQQGPTGRVAVQGHQP